MPTIVLKRSGTCRACGHMLRKGEYADFSSELGPSHPEPTCRDAPAQYRPNRRADRCGCGAWVKASEGRLLVQDQGPGKPKRYLVQCVTCARL